MSRPHKEVPWLSERDNGVFYVNWYDAGRTHRESLKTRDAGEATKLYGRFLIEGSRGSRTGGVDGLTVSVALDGYVAEHVDKNVVDKERQYDIVGHLKAYFGDTLISSVGPLESRAYADARRSGQIGGGKRRTTKTGSDSTIRRELNCLVAAANHAIKWKRLALADKPQVELPVEGHSEEVKWLTKTEVQNALKRTDGEFHDFILISYYTAARRRSVENLTKFQVDLENSRINLMAPGGRATKKRKPIVPIYPEILPAIERLMQTPGERLFQHPKELLSLVRRDDGRLGG